MTDRRADAVGGSGQDPPCSYWNPDWLHISERHEEELPGYNECELYRITLAYNYASKDLTLFDSRKLAQDLMMQYVCESRVDIVVISEPYRQLPYWFNDEGVDASIWVTLINGRYAMSETLVQKTGIVGIRVCDVFCVSGYSSPSTTRHVFDVFLRELDCVLKEGRKSASALMVAGDFNAKTRVWGGNKTEWRGTCLLNVITKCDLLPIRTTGNYSFLRNGRTSFPDILSINRRMRLSWRQSAALDWYSPSDHFYILHMFTSSVKRAVGGAFVYSTKQIDADSFLNKFDAIYTDHVLKIDESACGERLQNSMERTCAEDLRKKFPLRGKRRGNYW
ncbi:uncharacterized protein LOC117208541 [Bombus bifarius]|uniref:Uncharacterized protein LOC117208541 n=1 Tax=Bombus bifarius TaxID=103933 RepID=A0A6P8MBX4_9HYME|nr:uncharacterized protein LOC117208541 [Bombus bifarius]